MRPKALHALLILLVIVNPFWLSRLATAVVVLNTPPAALYQANTATVDNTPIWTRWHTDQYALAEDNESLWIGGAGGVIRWNIASQRYQRYSLLTGLPQQNIYVIAIDGAGNRWFGGDGGLTRLDVTNQWHHFTPANSGLYNDLVDGIAVADDNTLWLSHGLPDGPVSRFTPDGAWYAYPNLAAAVVVEYSQILKTHNPNRLWAVVGNEIWVGYWAYNGVSWANHTPSNGNAYPTTLAVWNNQQLWALDRNVKAWDGSKWIDTDLQNYTAFAVGPDQTLWGGGVYYPFMFNAETAAIGQISQPSTFHPLNKPNPVMALLPSESSVWAVGPSWLLLPNGAIVDFPDMPAFRGVTDALLDQQDHLWLYSQRLTSRCNDGAFQIIDDQDDALLDNDRWTIDQTGYGNLSAWTKAPGGDLWAAWEGSCRTITYSGPQYYHSGVWRSVGFVHDYGVTGPHISDIFVQDDSHLWFAYGPTAESRIRTSGVAAFDDRGTPTDLTDDLWHDYPITPTSVDGKVVLDPLGRLWLGNSHGLYRYTNNAWQVISDQSAVAHSICDLVATPNGTLYIQITDLYQQCLVSNTSILRIEPNDDMTTLEIPQAIGENFDQIQATQQHNRIWSVAPDGAVWYIGADTHIFPLAPPRLYRRTAITQTDYALPTNDANIQTLTIDTNNQVWLVANNSLWRMTTVPPTLGLRVNSSLWWLTRNTSQQGTIVANGYIGSDETIAVTLHDLPTGVTATLVPSTLAVGQSAALTLTTTADTMPGLYTLNLVGTSKTLTQSIPLTIVVANEIFELYLPTVMQE